MWKRGKADSDFRFPLLESRYTGSVFPKSTAIIKINKMRGVLHFLIGLTVIFCIECKVKQDTIDGAIVNSKVDRKIDVSTHLVKMSTSITLENTGKSPIKSFLYALEPSLQNYLSIITANVSTNAVIALFIVQFLSETCTFFLLPVHSATIILN